MAKYYVNMRVSDLGPYELLSYNDHEMARSTSKTISDNENLLVSIKAHDSTSLRASLDGYLKALKIYEITEKLIEDN